jgi:hypothetical protein
MKLVAVTLLVVAMLCNCMLAVAENPVPFRALMQTAGAEPAAPPKPDAKDAFSKSTTSTNSGKAERVTGGVLLGTGVAAITATLVIVSAAHGSAGHDGRVWAGIGGGAAMTGVGVSLIVLGSHKHSAK